MLNENDSCVFLDHNVYLSFTNYLSLFHLVLLHALEV
jgi:hypothetical protein